MQQEAERCLRCDSACLRCVEVCPNRANFALPVGEAALRRGSLTQPIQILHVDALCNECGNCGRFCPFQGEPYRGKPTLFRDMAALGSSKNAGFAFDGGEKPVLLLREAPGVDATKKSPFAEWSAQGAGGAMEELARTVFRDHGYLIGGQR